MSGVIAIAITILPMIIWAICQSQINAMSKQIEALETALGNAKTPRAEARGRG